MPDNLWTNLQRGGQRALARLSLRRSSADERGEPLFFHHIAKTGGTSLISAIRGMVGPALACSEDGNLSAAFTRGLVARGLQRGQFIYGHPGTGAALPLRGRCAMIALLREPRDQAISSYLHVRNHDTVPDHQLARQLDFREFLLARPYYAIYQTASLHVGIEEHPIARLEALIDRLPRIAAYLDEMRFVGTIDTVHILLAELASAMHWPSVPRFPHRRKSRLSGDLKAQMREQFEELRTHPALAPLFAAEREMFKHVRAIEQARCNAASASAPP
jgi:hypothetical protein